MTSKTPHGPGPAGRARRGTHHSGASRQPIPAARLGPDTRPLAIPAYRRLFFGQVTTVVGAMLTAVAVQQQIFDLTGSSAWVGVASLVALVPLVVFGLLGGAIADTYDRRKLLMITSTGIALTSIGLWLAALAGTESVWVVMALLAVQQGFFAVNQPTRSAIIPRIVPAELVPAANALSMTVFAIGVIVGPLLVGVLIPIDRAALAVLHRRADAGRRAVRGDPAAADPAAGASRPRPGQGAATGWPTCGPGRCC